MRKKSIAWFTLEKIGELGKVGLETFFPRNYAYTRVSRELFGLDRNPKVAPRTLSTILSRLAREGLVERKGRRQSSQWSVTKKGKMFLRAGNESVPVKLPKSDGVCRLVIFDIPEYERKKRTAIRVELIGCNFRQLQKSVWVGYHPLPHDFIMLLDELGLKDRVHIFSVIKSGTLRGFEK